MKPKLKWIVRILAALVLLASMAGAFYYFQIDQPLEEFRALAASRGPIDQSKLREAAHKALRWTPDHDALVILCDIADETSIPVLIRCLRKVSPPDKDGVMICTTAHCFQALRKASGRNLKFDIDTWEVWFRNYKAHGSPRLAMKEEAAALITEEYVRKYVRPLADPVALEAHHSVVFDQKLLDANHIVVIEVNPRHGESKTVYEDKSKHPPSDGMVTGVPNAEGVGFYYPKSADQPSVEVRMNYRCDAFGHIAIHVVVPNPLVIVEEQKDANKGAPAPATSATPER